MKKTTKVLSLALCIVMVLSLLAGCGKSEGSKNATGYKIGVLVADASGEEALAFKNYYTEYVAKQYGVEFIYSEALADEAAAKAQAETFIAQNCKAIIDMADKDRAAIAKLCNENKVYYAIASGVMTDDDFAASKGYEYFVGQVGPDTMSEYYAGVAMGEYYKGKVSKVAIYSAFLPNPMHVYRTAGIITGLGDTYKGNSGMAMVGDLFASNGAVDVADIAGDTDVIYYFQGFVGYGNVGTIDDAIAAGPDAVLGAGMMTTFYSANLNAAGIEFSDIDAFTGMAGDAMQNGKLTYLEGKYASSIGPVFALIQSAMNGAPIRDAEGNAVSVAQGYAVATSYEEYQNAATADAGENPTYSKAVLDTIIGTSDKAVTYDAFKSVVDAH